MKGRQIIQHLRRNNLNWDDTNDKNGKKLSVVEDIKITRCYKSIGFEKIFSYSLHHFCDASECGYGKETYLRIINDLEEVHFIFVKSRVAPATYVSIPRLDSSAGTMSVKISKMVAEELDIYISSEVFWTESQPVLSYINNGIRRLKIFVANRVQLIRVIQTLSNPITSQLIITLQTMHLE